MKKNPYYILMLLLLALASCKKDYPTYEVGPKLQIVFDDAIDKVTADYKIGTTLSLKIAATGATSVTINTAYTTGTVKTVNLGTFPVTNGVVTISIPANSLRAAADGTPIGAGATSTRAANTYTLTVDATDGTITERRYYTAVLVQ